jgi:hypothetical protein
MKKLKIILTIFFLSIGQRILACDCDNQGEFLTVAPKTKLVALVKVTKYLTFKDINGKQTPMSMEVEIIEVFKGKEKRKSIIVYGDNGNLCRPYLSGFGIGKFYLTAFDPGLEGSKGFTHMDEKLTDYSISICGEYWLNVDIENKIASGSIADNPKQITLTDLKTKLNTR